MATVHKRKGVRGDRYLVGFRKSGKEPFWFTLYDYSDVEDFICEYEHQYLKGQDMPAKADLRKKYRITRR